MTSATQGAPPARAVGEVVRGAGRDGLVVEVHVVVDPEVLLVRPRDRRGRASRPACSARNSLLRCVLLTVSCQ